LIVREKQQRRFFRLGDKPFRAPAARRRCAAIIAERNKPLYESAPKDGRRLPNPPVDCYRHPASGMTFATGRFVLGITMKKAFRKPQRNAATDKKSAAAPSCPAQASSPAPPPAADASPATASFLQALAAHRVGRTGPAEAGYRETLRLDPDHPHANNNLAILLRAAQRLDEAVACYRAAVRGAPADPQIRSNLGCVLVDMFRNAEAATCMTAALALDPQYAEAFFNLGNVQRNFNRSDQAEKSYRRALRIKPALAEAHANLGDVHKARGELTEAAACFRAALALRPGMAEPCNNLGETLKEQGLIEEAIILFQQGVRQNPGHALLHSNLLFALHYTAAPPPEIIARAHGYWDEKHARPLLPAQPRYDNARDPDRRLRVGYVSPDFCAHSCAYFSEPLLRAHDRTEIEVYCYPTSRREDVVTRRFYGLADAWRPLAGVGDDAAAAMVRQDEIDILVDLAGHTCDSRLLVFARRPAPVQVSWLGYPDTTGMTAIDYRFTDAVADPPGDADRRHVEKLIRLDGGFLSYQPVVDAPLQETPPMLKCGYPTFGSFNNTAKVTPDVVRVWARILKEVPGSRMIVKSRALGDAAVRSRYAALFAAQGVSPDQVDLLPRLEPADNHLRAYDRIDIGLDPFPYNGTTTTCEALWMGVPVASLAGEHHVARVGASLLTQCGLADLATRNEEDYVAAAVALARNPTRLADLRRTMRARLHASSLTDYDGFARKVETAYRRMWRDWLSGAGA
jgi:protein O-GlcNAc transferase